MRIEYVLTGYEKFDNVIRDIAQSRNGWLVKKDADFKGDLVVIMSMHPGVFEAQQRLRAQGRPFLFIDHAYFKRGHENRNYRMVSGGLYNAALYTGDDSRVAKWGIRYRPWRSGGDYVLVIMPAPNVQKMLGVDRAQEWLGSNARAWAQRLGLPVRLKAKDEGSIDAALSRAALAVSYASAADVQAACAGVPGVYSPESPAHALSITEYGQEPDRSAWARSLSWQQWNVAEMRQGLHWPVYGY